MPTMPKTKNCQHKLADGSTCDAPAAIYGNGPGVIFRCDKHYEEMVKKPSRSSERRNGRPILRVVYPRTRSRTPSKPP